MRSNDVENGCKPTATRISTATTTAQMIYQRDREMLKELRIFNEKDFLFVMISFTVILLIFRIIVALIFYDNK